MSPAYRVHPEFGYFCLSPRFRSKMRRAGLAFVAAGAFIGMVVWRADYDSRDASALTIAAFTESPSTTDSAGKPAKATPTTERSPVPQAAADTMAEGSQPEIAETTGAHKPRRLHAANEVSAIAAIPLGQSPIPPAGGSPGPAQLDGAPSTTSNAPTAVEPSVRPTSIPKEQRKKSLNPVSDRQTVLPGSSASAAPSKAERARAAGASSKTSAKPAGKSTTASQEPRKASRSQKSVGDSDRVTFTSRGLVVQVRECVETGRCRAGERFLRTLFPNGM
jgi:hypothetical protein